MGWSCRVEAGETLDNIIKYCLRETKSQNTYRSTTDKGRRFFWELPRTEHTDGAITGLVFELKGDPEHPLCYSKGSYRIEGDGTITRFPHISSRVWPMLQPKDWREEAESNYLKSLGV